MNTITLTISAATLNAIGAGLRELPYKFAAPAIKEIDEQVQKALQDEQTERAYAGEHNAS